MNRTIYHDTKTKIPFTPAAVPDAASHPAPAEAGDYEAGLTTIGEFDTVESFCRYFNWLKPPSKLDRNSNYHLFKSGIKPMWEDEANANGGKWVLTMKNNPALLDRCWQWLTMALVGEELDEGDEICGAVVSLRSKVDRIQLWTRSKDDVEKMNGIGRKFVKLLDVSEADGIGLEFQVCFPVISPTNRSDIYDCFSTTQKTVHSQTNSSPSKPFPNPASDRPSTPNQEASPPPSQPSVMPDPLSLQALAPAVHSEVSVWVAVALSEAEAEAEEEEAEAGARRVADRSLVALLFLLLNHIRPFDLRPGPASVSLFVPTCCFVRIKSAGAASACFVFRINGSESECREVYVFPGWPFGRSKSTSTV